MPFDVWYDVGAPKAPDPTRPFQQWRFYTPRPRTPAEAGKAVEKLLAKVQPLAINITKSRDEPKTDKPHHD